MPLHATAHGEVTHVDPATFEPRPEPPGPPFVQQSIFGLNGSSWLGLVASPAAAPARAPATSEAADQSFDTSRPLHSVEAAVAATVPSEAHGGASRPLTTAERTASVQPIDEDEEDSPAEEAAAAAASGQLDCDKTSYREVPEVEAYKVPECSNNNRTYREWSPVVVALLHPTPEDARRICSLDSLHFDGHPDAHRPEVILYRVVSVPQGGAKDAQEAAALRDACPGDNHFVIHATFDEGSARAVNRMMRMASGDAVVVAEGRAAMALTKEWLEHAWHVGRDHANCALVAEAEQTTSRPVLLKRTPFLEMGQLQHPKCGARMEHAGGVSCELQSSLQRLASGMEKLGMCTARLIYPGAATWSRGFGLHASNPPGVASGCSRMSWEAMDKCVARGDDVQATGVVEYFKRKANIKKVLAPMRGVPKLELVVADDSRTEYTELMRELTGRHFLVELPNLHEIRAYNRIAKFSRAPLVAFLQDDDSAPLDKRWFTHACTLFNNLPSLAVLGGFRGRMDIGLTEDPRHNFIPGPKYGPIPSDVNEQQKCCTPIGFREPKSGIPFMYMYKVNTAPMIVRRSVFMQLGMFHTGFSCVGDAGIGFDYEMSIRAWKNNFHAGLYYSKFQFAIDQKTSGTHVGVQAQIRHQNELHNNKALAQLYPGFHHARGTSMAMQKLKSLRNPSGYRVPSAREATKRFCERSPSVCASLARLDGTIAAIQGEIKEEKVERKVEERAELRALRRAQLVEDQLAGYSSNVVTTAGRREQRFATREVREGRRGRTSRTKSGSKSSTASSSRGGRQVHVMAHVGGGKHMKVGVNDLPPHVSARVLDHALHGKQLKPGASHSFQVHWTDDKSWVA